MASAPPPQACAFSGLGLCRERLHRGNSGVRPEPLRQDSAHVQPVRSWREHHRLRPRETGCWEAARLRVLIVEDDRELAEAIAVGLRREQMAVDLAVDREDGLDRALVTSYDVIVLDRDLP